MGSLRTASPPPDLSWRSKGITNLTVHVVSSQNSKAKARTITRPARWKSLEFLFYAVVFVIIVPYLAYVPVALSQPSHPNYSLYRFRLSPGWLFGREIDNSDPQYRSFRNNLGALGALSTLHLISTRAYARLRGINSNKMNGVPFLVAFELLMIVALHGSSAIKILAILLANYLIAKSLGPSRTGLFATWAFNLAVLIANEIYDGYQFGHIHHSLESLDSYRGFYPRWNVSFNISMLRLISFNVDYYWACRSGSLERPDGRFDERARMSTSHPQNAYSLHNFIAYVLYPPLYIAGPIMSFNDFLWQLHRPSTITVQERISYAIRFIVSLLTMEIILHSMYVVALKDSKAWSGDSPFELTMIGFWNLAVIWLKLLIPWRFFRLWALLDGMDPPENMIRCVYNNYSTLAFWRSWHRSYNIWLIRYIYIPVGGSTSPILPKLIVFTFVALWHDLSMRLLIWGWMISFFLLPEIIATKLLPESKYGDEPWYRHVCAIGGALNVIMMMAANLTGFVLGVDGAKHLVKEVFTTGQGIQFFLVALPCLFIAVQVMFEYREQEKRKGIVRKC